MRETAADYFECKGNTMRYTFRPSSPNDKHLAEVERQQWEREMENKKDDFPYIALTRSQYKILKESQKDAVIVTAENENDIAVLCDHRFVFMLAKDDKNGIIARPRGNNYVAYAKKQGQKEWSITARDCIVAAIGALCGFLLNCLLSG